jgi:glutamyl-tRNA synthetase
VIRGDEWISSVPVHLQLFDAAGFEPIPYAHIAPLLKTEGNGKRKLSKRKDPEASVEFYIDAGYPAPSVLYYLRGLLNGRLAEVPLEEALRAPLRLSECGVSGALVDLVKLNDISADYVATMPSKDILNAVLTWADGHDPELAQAVRAEQDLAVRALDIERTGVENPRKDMRSWSEFRPIYGYFFTALFEPVSDPADSRFGGLSPEVVRRLCNDLLASYQQTEPDAWFDQIRQVAENNGFAASVKDFKNHPAAYVGSIREASQVIRVLLTGSTRSPALHLVALALGEAEVRRRIGAVLDENS